MPNYDFICQICNKKFVYYLTYIEYGKKSVDCPICGSSKVARRITRVRIVRSANSRLENLDDVSTPEGMAQAEENPQALGRMMRKMSGELGEEMPPEFDEVVDRLEKGQTPEEIERDIPEYAGEGEILSGEESDPE